MTAFFLILLTGLLTPNVTVFTIIFWRGTWRRLALVPPALMALYCVKIAIDFIFDPTSHNLLPFELLTVYALAAPYYVVLAAVRWFVRRRSRPARAGLPGSHGETTF